MGTFFLLFFVKMLKFVVLALFVAVALAGWDISYVNGDGDCTGLDENTCISCGSGYYLANCTGVSVAIPIPNTDDCGDVAVPCVFTASEGSSTWIWIVLAIAVVLVIVVVIAAGVGFFLWKKKQKESYATFDD